MKFWKYFARDIAMQYRRDIIRKRTIYLSNTFPRGEGGQAIARSDEDRRNVPITNAVRKKGTILKTVPSYSTALRVLRCRRSSSAPFGGTFPPGEGIGTLKDNLLLF